MDIIIYIRELFIYIRANILWIIIFLLIGLVVFCNSLSNDFIWDDELQIVENPYIRSIANIPFFFQSSTFYYKYDNSLIGMFYRPIMMSAYSFIYYLFGLKSWWFHFAQLLLHAVNSYIVFLILRRMVKKIPIYIAVLLGIVFMVHPIQSEVVSYAANLQDVLFFLFGSVAFYIAISKRMSHRKLLLVLALLGLSLFSKETGILFVAVTGIYFYFFNFQLKIRYMFGVAAVVVFYAYTRCWVAGICSPGSHPNPIGELPFLKFLIQIPAIAYYYLKLIAYPVEPAAGQDWVVRNISWKTFYWPLFVTVFAACFFFYIMLRLANKKSPYFKVYVLFFLWFALGLLFHFHIIPLDFTVADRWLYFPIAGFVGMVGVAIGNFSERTLKKIAAILVIVIILFSVRTYVRNRDWKDNFTLFSRDVSKSDRSFHFENNLGAEYHRRGNMQDAERHFLRASDYAPRWYTPRLNLCIIYHRRRELMAAKKCYEEVIEMVKMSLNPHIKQPYINYRAVIEELNEERK